MQEPERHLPFPSGNHVTGELSLIARPKETLSPGKKAGDCHGNLQQLLRCRGQSKVRPVVLNEL